MRAARFLAVSALLLAVAAHVGQGRLAPAALAQATQQDADRFIKLLRSYDYEKLIGDQVVTTDRQMAPPCNGARKIVSRQAVVIIEPPQFVATRDVPIAGRWLEKVTVSRCGRNVRHNVFLFASKIRGLHAVAGFPGDTRAGVDLQFEVAKAVIANARRINPTCRRLDIVDTSQTSAAAPGESWREIWTTWACGTLLSAEVRYAAKTGGGVGFTVR